MSLFDDITDASLRNRYGSVEIDNVSSSDPDTTSEASIAAALEDAKAEAGQYVRQRYSVAGLAAGTQTPESLKRIVCDIARFRLYNDESPEEVDKRYRTAREDLKSLAAGRSELYDNDAAVLAAWDTIDSRGGAESGEQGGPVAPRRAFVYGDKFKSRYG